MVKNNRNNIRKSNIGDVSSFIAKRFKALIVISLLLIIPLLTVGMIFFGSHKQIDYNEYGLNQNMWTYEIEDKLYEEGFHNIGFFNKFIRFPSTWQTIDFSDSENADYHSLSAKTADGLDVWIELSFQYKLQKETILQLYSEFGHDYEDYFVNVARGTLRNIAAEFNAVDFFYDRTTIDNVMRLGLQNKSGDFMCEVGEFQLRETQFPEAFEKAIEDVVVAQQQVEVANYNQQVAVINAQTAIIEAQAEIDIAKMKAENNAEIAVIEAKATAEALNITMTAEGEALARFMGEMNFNSTQILTYLWIQAIQESNAEYLIIGENAPIILEPTNTTQY